MLNDEAREILVSICYGDASIDQLDPSMLVDAIKSIMKENDELRDISRTEQGEEIIHEDKAVKDEDEYL